MSILRSFRGRNVGDWRCLGEAALLHLCVAAALRMAPYARLQRALERFSRTPRRTRASVPDVTWAIGAVGRRIGATCLAEATVAYTMLRRHGHDPRLRIGVRRGDAALEAHAWVECDGTVVTGERADLTGYAMLG